MYIKVNCLECGHPMDLSESYEDYEGEVRCWGCRTVMKVALREGKLQSMGVSSGGLPGQNREAGNSRARPPESDKTAPAVEQESR